MPISTPTAVQIDVIQFTANRWKITGFAVQTATDNPSDDRLIVLKAAQLVDPTGVVIDQRTMRLSQYTQTTTAPTLADLVTRIVTGLGLAVPAGVTAAQLSQLGYTSLRDALYAGEQRAGEFPADAT